MCSSDLGSQIGTDGRSLAVIALEIRTQTQELETAATQALTHIGALEGQAKVLNRNVETSNASGAQNAASSLNMAVERLRKAGESLNTDQYELGQLGGLVVRGLQKAATGADIEFAVGTSLDSAVKSLGEVAGSAVACDEDVMPHVVTFLSKLSATHTMAQERNVHQVMAAAYRVPNDPDAAEPVAVAPVEDLDDLLF